MLNPPPRATPPTSRPSTKRPPRTLILSALAVALLVACGTEPIKIEYRLDNILPSPITPGETVTAFGILPEQATLRIDGTSVTGSSVPDGLSFKVPNTLSAGDHKVAVESGETHLEASLSVKPRVDAVSLEGSILRVSGAGWGSSNPGGGAQSTLASGVIAGTSILIDGLEFTPSIEPNPSGVTPSSNEANPSPVMRISLPDRLPYGSFSVIVRVVRISRYSSAGFHRKSSAHQTTHHPRNEVTQDQHYAPVTSSRVNFRFDFRKLSPANSSR